MASSDVHLLEATASKRIGLVSVSFPVGIGDCGSVDEGQQAKTPRKPRGCLTIFINTNLNILTCPLLAEQTRQSETSFPRITNVRTEMMGVTVWIDAARHSNGLTLNTPPTFFYCNIVAIAILSGYAGTYSENVICYGLTLLL
jgi:hypothetical protein